MPRFSTIQYCVDNNVPCFTFPMDHTKACYKKWKDITSDNFKTHLNTCNNGFAVITGFTHFVIDFDSKHNPPTGIYDILYNNCEAVEKTPGGYHFWFKIDSRVAHFTSTTDAFWDSKKVKGIDIRASGGICYTSPSSYTTQENTLVKYSWIKGNLSTASEVPSEILEHLHYDETAENDTFTFTLTKDPDATTVEDSALEPIPFILNSLSKERVNDYTQWIQVGMALKNSGYDCSFWDEWSASSPKYKPGVCQQKWNTFASGTGGPLTINSIYYWLKNDNYEVFIQLQSAKKRLQNELLQCTQKTIADTFYQLNTSRYIYSVDSGWYYLLPNNTWKHTGSKDIMKIPNLLNDMHNDCCDILNYLLGSLNKTKDHDKTLYKQIGEAIKRLSCTNFLKGTTAFLQGLYYMPDVDRQFNQKRHLFAFNNGVLDMDLGEFRPIDPQDYITITCGYNYREPLEEEKAIVMNFMKSIFPKKDVLDYVLRALSTTFWGYNKAEFFHVFTGLGANGKSCLMDLCRVVFGNYYQTISATYFTKDDDGKKDTPCPALALGMYSRMLVFSEPESSCKLQVSFIKPITGNDEISVRNLYSSVLQTYVPQFKIWGLTNDIPKLSKYDQGIERRMRIVNFPTRFVYNPTSENEALRDDSIKKSIADDPRWAFGFLGLLLDASEHVKKDSSIPMPEEVLNATKEYMLENNPVGAWLHANYSLTGRKDHSIQNTELYNKFLDESGVHKTQKEFASDILKCSIGEKKVNGIRYYYGLIRKA